MAPRYGANQGRKTMITTHPVPISELSDTELDTVAAGGGYFVQVAKYNVAKQWAANYQANLAVVNYDSSQGGSQVNNNNAGNQAV